MLEKLYERISIDAKIVSIPIREKISTTRLTSAFALRYFGRGVQSGKLCSDLMELTWKTYIRKIETKAMALSLARVQRATCANETAEKWPENGPTDSPVVNPDCKRAFIIRRPGEGEGEREVHNGEPRGRLVSAAF